MNKSLAEKILSFSDGQADAAEVFIRSSLSTTIEVKNQQVDAFERSNDIGAGLRLIARGRSGFSFTTEFGDDALKRLVMSAITNAKNTEPDEYSTIPAKPAAAYPTVSIYDPKIAGLTEKEKIERVKGMESATFSVDQRIKRIRKASASFSQAETLILNSHGAEVSWQSTAYSSSIEAVAEDKGESQAGSDFDVNRFYDKLRIEETGRRAAQKALDLLGAKSIGSLKAPVVLEATVAREFLSIMANGFSAESVQKKRSLFMGKLEKEVCAPIVTVRDDGLLPGGLGSAPSDDEAVPMQNKTVIDQGRLLLFLHNTYTAKKDKTLSTGNGMRGGFKGIPGVSITNLYIEPGTCSFSELISQAGRGLLVTEVMGMHTANPISGDFSVGATGFWIENGVKTHPIREVTIAGNIIDLMKNVEVVGGDLRFSARIGSPSLLIKELSIAGK